MALTLSREEHHFRVASNAAKSTSWPAQKAYTVLCSRAGCELPEERIGGGQKYDRIDVFCTHVVPHVIRHSKEKPYRTGRLVGLASFFWCFAVPISFTVYRMAGPFICSCPPQFESILSPSETFCLRTPRRPVKLTRIGRDANGRRK